LERAELMPVPAPFDGYVERPARVSSTCLVSVGRNRYSVPCEYAGKWVSSRLYPTRIEVVADDALIASHVRLLDRDQVSYDWQHYLPLIERKPGALRNGAPFADLPAPLRQLKHGLGRHAGGDRIMAQVLAAVPVAGLDAVLVAVELVLESGSLSQAAGPAFQRLRAESGVLRDHRGAPGRDRTTTQRRNPLVAQGSPRRQHGALRPPAWPDRGDRSCVI